MSTLRLEATTLQDMGEFKGPVEINWAGLPGVLTAIVGENGAGKSTLTELALPGALYRRTPTRGTLGKLARGRDSFLESTIRTDRQYVIRHTVDKHTDGGESVVLCDGEPAFKSAKRRDYDDWRKQKLPPDDLLYAATFTVQGSTGFLGMTEGDRRSVLLRMLGIEHYQDLAKRARAKAENARQSFELAASRLADEQGRGLSAEQAEKGLEDAEEAARLADEAEAQAKAELAEVERMQAEIEAAVTEIARLQKEATAHTGQVLTYQMQRDSLAGRLGALQVILSEEEASRAQAARFEELDYELSEARTVWAKLDGIEKRRQAAMDTYKDAMTRQANNLRLLGDAESIRAAVVEDARLCAEHLDLGRKIAELEQLRYGGTKDKEGAERRKEDGKRAMRDLLTRLERTRAKLVGKDLVAAAVRDLPFVELAVSTARTALKSTQRELDVLSSSYSNGSNIRIHVLRDGLEQIEKTGTVSIARKTLADDDELLRDVQSRPIQIAAKRTELDAAYQAEQEATHKLCETRDLAGKASAMLSAETELAELDAEEGRLTKAITNETSVIADLVVREAALSEKYAAAMAKAQTIEEERAKLADRLKLKPRLDEASAKVEAWTKVADRAKADFTGCDQERGGIIQPRPILVIEGELAKVEDAPAQLRNVEQAKTQAKEVCLQLAQVDAKLAELSTVILPTPPVVPHKDRILDRGLTAYRVNAAQDTARTCHGMVAVAKARIEQARASQATMGRLEADRAQAERNMCDWQLLADGLGAEGIQALEIDAAGPTLNAMVNDLLHQCHGPRFTMTVNTQRLDSDGKRMLECCQVLVLDTEKGREDEGYTYSGGERVILGEALSLAMSMFACQRSGLKGACLVRDESGAALDPKNGKAYVAMLRRAASLVEASRVLLISHDPRITEMVDSTLRIANGKVEVVVP